MNRARSSRRWGRHMARIAAVGSALCVRGRFALCLAISLACTAVAALGQEQQAAQASSLLSYIAVDYADSVQNGEVVDENLYRQQRRNVARALQLVRELPERPGRSALETSVLELDKAVAEKRDVAQVRRRANGVADRLAGLYQIQRSPAEPLPAAATAAPLFKRYCAECHGLRGRGGDSAPALDDPQRMASFSLYDFYNVLDPTVESPHADIAGGELDSSQRWALAVAVANLAATDLTPPAAELAQRYPALIGLPGLATARPLELPADAAGALLWWRGHPQHMRALQHPLARADGLLQVAETTYRAGDFASAYHQLMVALRQDYLPLRQQLRERDAPLAAQLEQHWQSLREAILVDASSAEVIAAFQRLRTALTQAQAKLQPVKTQSTHYLVTGLMFAGAVILGLLLWWGLRRRRA